MVDHLELVVLLELVQAIRTVHNNPRTPYRQDSEDIVDRQQYMSHSGLQAGAGTRRSTQARVLPQSRSLQCIPVPTTFGHPVQRTGTQVPCLPEAPGPRMFDDRPWRTGPQAADGSCMDCPLPAVTRMPEQPLTSSDMLVGKHFLRQSSTQSRRCRIPPRGTDHLGETTGHRYPSTPIVGGPHG